MIIHPDFIFAHMPKTGGSFIRKNLLELFPDAELLEKMHVPIKSLKNYDKKFIFGSIRNPFDWYVSYWGASKQYGDKNERRMLEESNGFDNFKNHIKYILNNNINFDILTKLNICHKQDIGLMTYRYLYSFCDKINVKDHKFLVDKILYQENLRDDFYSLLVNDLGISSEKAYKIYSREKVNVSERKRNFMEYYDDELINLIKQKDKLVFEKFNY